VGPFGVSIGCVFSSFTDEDEGTILSTADEDCDRVGRAATISAGEDESTVGSTTSASAEDKECIAGGKIGSFADG